MLIADADGVGRAAVSAREHGMVASGWAFVGFDGVRDAPTALKRTGMAAERRRLAVEAMNGWLFVDLHSPSTRADDAFVLRSANYTAAFFNQTWPPAEAAVARHAALRVRDAVLMYAHAASKALAAGSRGNDGLALVRAISGRSAESARQDVLAWKAKDETGVAMII